MREETSPVITTDAPKEPMPSSDQLHQEIVQLRKDLESRWKDDRIREEQIAVMQKELEAHRQGLVERLLNPLVDGIIRIHDDTSRLMAQVDGKDTERWNHDRFLKWIHGFQSDLEEILENSGIHTFEEPVTTYEPTRQHAVRTQGTDDANAHRQIVERICPGFERLGRIIRKEQVVVYVHHQAESENQQPSSEEGA